MRAGSEGGEDPVLVEVARIVAGVAGPSRTPGEITRDTRLADGYWLDSVELLEVVIACETAFDIAFDAEQDAAAHAFETLGSLADVIRARVAERSA